MQGQYFQQIFLMDEETIVSEIVKKKKIKL